MCCCPNSRAGWLLFCFQVKLDFFFFFFDGMRMEPAFCFQIVVQNGCCFVFRLCLFFEKCTLSVFCCPTVVQNGCCFVFRLSLNTITLNIESNNVYTQLGVAISVTGIAQVSLVAGKQLQLFGDVYLHLYKGCSKSFLSDREGLLFQKWNLIYICTRFLEGCIWNMRCHVMFNKVS